MSDPDRIITVPRRLLLGLRAYLVTHRAELTHGIIRRHVSELLSGVQSVLDEADLESGRCTWCWSSARDCWVFWTA